MQPGEPTPARAYLRISLATAAVVAALWFGPAGVRGLETPTHEILASGDLVPGFGRVGTADIQPEGIDARGRVLLRSELSDGAEGLFWAADSGVTTVWLVDAPGADFARIGPVVTNDRGDVLAGGLGNVDLTNNLVTGLYRIRDGVAEAVVRRGDVSADGDTICEFGAFAINDAGRVAFDAAPAVDGDCADLAPHTLYVVQGQMLSRVAVALPDGAPHALHLLGLADDGTILANVLDGGRVLALADGATRTVVADNVDGPSGMPIAAVHGTGANAVGDVVFLGWEGDRFGVYRTRGTEIVRVVSVGDATPDGDPIASIDTSEPQLGAAGDVVLRVEWSGSPHSTASGALAIAPDGSARFAPHAGFAAVNATGSVAMSDPSTHGASRWQRNALVPLLRAGDPAPNGAVFATGGLLGGACLGADGRVGAQATATDGASGLLCADSDGLTTIARVGDPAPEGGRFVSFFDCAFAPDGSLFFGAASSASSRDQRGLYRATAAGIERIAGSGTVTADGELIDALAVGDGPIFDVNARGTVLLDAWIANRPHLMRVEPGAAPAVVRFDLGGPPFPPLSLDGGIDDGDRVYAVAGLPDDQSIVVSDGDRTTVLTSIDDLQTPLGPIAHVNSVRARGNRLLIFGADVAHPPRFLQYTTEDGFADVLPEQRPFRLLDFTEQRTLIETSAASGAEQLLLDPDGLHRLGVRRQPFEPAALAVNDRSNLLFLTDRTPLGTARHALSLSGPAPEGRCFAPPTAVYTDPPPPPPPTSDDCAGNECSHLIVDAVGGAPGDAVQLSVTLDSGPWFVAGVQGDVASASALRVGGKANGRPACRVNPDIAKSATVFSFQPTGCDPGATCTAVRALVLALDNLDAIANGARLFTCDATIAADAAPGHYPIALDEVGASDPNGVALPCGGIAGDLDVHDSGSEPQQPPVVQSGGGDSGGCQVGSRHTGGSALVLAAALLLRVVGARRSRSRKAAGEPARSERRCISRRAGSR